MVRFDAAAGAVDSVIELESFGDCETFATEEFEPRPDPSLTSVTPSN